MVECLYYNRIDAQREIFVLSALSTLEVTTLLDESIKVQDVQAFSYATDTYLGENIISKFDTIEAFNRFFVNNPQFHIHDCNLQLENGLKISSHDDSEVHIEQPVDFEGGKLIKDIFKVKGLSEALVSEVKSHPGCYCSLDREGRVKAVHESFDDYLNSSA